MDLHAALFVMKSYVMKSCVAFPDCIDVYYTKEAQKDFLNGANKKEGKREESVKKCEKV